MIDRAEGPESAARASRSGSLPDTSQCAFEFRIEAMRLETSRASERVEFQVGDPSRMFVGDVPLVQYVERNGLREVTALRQLIAELDLSAFIAAYKPGGRWPIHPRILIGLIVYGIHLRLSSLRELEMLAIRDVGAWLLCEGIQPDHSTIGKFVVRHEGLLSDGFFISTTKALARKLGLGEGDFAADGTIIQAASSVRTLAKKAVLEEQAAIARQQADASSQASLHKKAERLEEAVAVAQERTEKREQAKRSEAQVSRIEPEAPNQLCKDGTFRLAYKPSVLVHESQLIVGQAVDPMSEIAVLEPMLNQSEAIGVQTASLALDAGYYKTKVLQLAVERDLDLLCPPRVVRRNEAGIPVGNRGHFSKAAFRYNEERDVYICPAGAEMTPGQWLRSPYGLRLRAYRTKACKGCSLRSKCTSSKRRKIDRWEGEELREAMMLVFEQPTARRKYQRRSKIVERVFAELKERQGLKRFRRRGLKGVRVEFALHCLAFNLKRAVALVVVVTVSTSFRGRFAAISIAIVALTFPLHP